MWQILSAAGGGLALTFIVGIAVGVFAGTLIYVASAVVVLERFALASVERRWIAVFGTLAAVLATGFLLRARWLEAWFGDAAQTVGLAGLMAVTITALSIGVCRLALARTRSSRRGTLVLALLALAGALWLGSTARFVLAAAPAVVIAGLAFALRTSRLGSGADEAKEATLERQLLGVAAGLALGALLAAALPQPP